MLIEDSFFYHQEGRRSSWGKKYYKERSWKGKEKKRKRKIYLLIKEE